MKNLLMFIMAFAFAITSCTSPADSKQEACKETKECCANSISEITKTPARPAGQEDAIELRATPIETVRVAIIGIGMRGITAVNRLSQIDGTDIVAICDVVPENVKKGQELLKKNGRKEAELYTGAEDWKKICERDDIDLIYICTHWDLHTPIGVYAMEHGKHVASEVPAALTIEECWKLINTSERTRKHFMQLENCNYDFFEIATLKMAQAGVFGEVIHAEGAYIHDLRYLNFREEDEKSAGYWNMWRLENLAVNDCNTYPTHGLGPVAHIMNIHRGDKMNYLVSVSTGQFGMTEYAKNKFGEDSEYAKRKYKKGDMNTTIIKTHKGRTIMIQHDVTSPRPYSRLHTVSGTKGFAQKYPSEGIALEPNAHGFLKDEDRDALIAKYTPEFVKILEKKAREVEGAHGGMDYIMDSRLIYCLQKGLPLDQDVYDAAEWSSIVELSRLSVENKSMPIQIPDFTRGAWNKVNTVTYFE